MSRLKKKACPLMISMQHDRARVLLQRRIGRKLQLPDVHKFKAAVRADSGVVQTKQAEF